MIDPHKDNAALTDEELVRNAKNDKRAVSELIARYLRTVE